MDRRPTHNISDKKKYNFIEKAELIQRYVELLSMRNVPRRLSVWKVCFAPFLIHHSLKIDNKKQSGSPDASTDSDQACKCVTFLCFENYGSERILAKYFIFQTGQRLNDFRCLHIFFFFNCSGTAHSALSANNFQFHIRISNFHT